LIHLRCHLTCDKNCPPPVAGPAFPC
jgi:hypothetical protein